MENLHPGSIMAWLRHRSSDWSGPETYHFPTLAEPDKVSVNITKLPYGILSVEIYIVEIDRQFDFQVPIPRAAVRAVPGSPGRYGLAIAVTWDNRLQLYLNDERVEVIVI